MFLICVKWQKSHVLLEGNGKGFSKRTFIPKTVELGRIICNLVHNNRVWHIFSFTFSKQANSPSCCEERCPETQQLHSKLQPTRISEPVSVSAALLHHTPNALMTV